MESLLLCGSSILRPSARFESALFGQKIAFHLQPLDLAVEFVNLSLGLLARLTSLAEQF
jgi:hypothetical protein